MRSVLSKLLIAGAVVSVPGWGWAQNSLSFLNSNLIIGPKAGLNNSTGTANVFIGSQAGFTNTTGAANLFLGQLAGFSNSTGTYNTFIGSSSGQANTVGANNNFIGNGAGLANTEGGFNVFIGSEAGGKNRRGGSNVHIGGFAGKENLEGSFNTFIGHNANVPAGAGLTNVTVLGYNALATASNSVILGSGANVGIGNTAPGNKLEITQGTAGNSGLRFTNLTINSTPVPSQMRFLTLNASGDVILGSVPGAGRLGADTDGLWQTNGDNLQNANAGSVLIGPGISKTPTGYRLYVADGILTEKVKVAVKSTNDWSDRVFDNGYKLRNLQEVEHYIRANKHLPGIPSAKEMVAKGNDLHQTDARLLEKIEELTLYSIQLERTNKHLEQEINEIKQQQALLEQMLKKLVGRDVEGQHE